MTNLTSRTPGRFSCRLMAGAAIGVLAGLPASAAFAQASVPAPAASTVQEIVVTGTSIRGVAPVGSTVVSVGQQAIQETAAQTVQQVLQNVPAVVGLQSAGQGAFGSADGAGTDAPSIHGLGASASNSTLILIDGHRLPLSGLNHELADPNILPPLALQRVEVLTDGASSIYGSDAVAGVINFITRRNYSGVETDAQAGFANNYHTYDAGFVAGKTWDGGSGLIAYNYSYKSDLLAGNRSFAQANHTAQGGSNLASFACGQATIGIGSTIYASPYTTGVANAAANAPCDYSGRADLLPSETRNSLIVKANQDVGDRLTFDGQAVYSNRYDVTQNVRGTVTTTVFGPGNAAAVAAGQVYPYFVQPTGTTATSETLRWDANALLGPGAHTNASEETFYANGSADYKIAGDWRATGTTLFGENTSRQQIIGAVNGSVANLALNGTTNGAGNLTTPSIPGSTVTVLNTPLTTANTLNVFNLGANSSTLLANLANSTQTRFTRHDIADVGVRLGGSLFNLPAGAVKLSVGGEYTHYALHEDLTLPLNIGPATSGSSTTNLDMRRSVSSAYGEVLVPLIAPEQTVPLVRRLDLSVSGRFDHYSDFGNTTNPKFGATWEVIEGLKLRGSYAESFVAPSLTSVGVPTGQYGITGESGFGAYTLGAVNVPVSAYSTLASVPGCTAGAATCQLGTTITGLQITGGNRYLKPETGKSWSVGSDYVPAFLSGLKISATYWHNEILGAITAPLPSLAVNSAGLSSLLKIYPTGATPAQIAAATAGLTQTTALPSTVYFIYDYQQLNAINLWVEGLDYLVSYDFNTDYGHFGLSSGGSYETRFDEQIGTGGAKFSVLNTTGFNTTFPSVQYQARSSVNWISKVGVSVDLFWNHTGSYKNWSSTTVTPITKSANNVPIGGGDTVAANDTFDGHVAYDFKTQDFWTRGFQVYVDVQNMFDKKPPFYNTAVGYDTLEANPIGRVVSVGMRKRW